MDSNTEQGMGIKAVIGPAGSGKTYRCIQALRTAEKEERQAILIVPDQFTYAADRMLLNDPAIEGVRHARILSFSRLARLSLGKSTNGPILSEQGRRMLLRRIVDESTSEQLGPLARIKETLGFVDALATSLKEIKGIAGKEAADQLTAAAGTNQKVSALAHLIGAYDEALAEKDFTDPEEAIHSIAEQLIISNSELTGAEIWVDGFASFTHGDKLLLAALVEIASTVQVTLCCDPGDADLALSSAADASAHGISPLAHTFFQSIRPRLTRPAFLPTLRTLVWLKETFIDHWLPVDLLPETAYRFGKSTELSQLEANLFREGPHEDTGEAITQVTGQVTTKRFSHPYHEVLAWATWIDIWTRNDKSPIRYRDIALIIRNVELYSPLIAEIFGRYKIPFFADRRRDATAHPIIKLTLAALRIAHQGWHREAVVGFLRNPVLGLSPDIIDRVENLSLEYGIEYERWWRTDWETPPLPEREKFDTAHSPTGDDLELSNDDNEEDTWSQLKGSQHETRDLNSRRRALAADEARAVSDYAFGPLRDFTDLWRGGEPEFTTIAAKLRDLIFTFLVAGVDNPLSNDYEKSGLQNHSHHLPSDQAARDALLAEAISGREFITWDAEANDQVLSLLQNTLSTGADLMGELEVPIGLMTKLLREAFSKASIGQTPRILDAVIVAEPRRSRVNEAARVIVGGLDAASVPRAHTEDPIFSDAEREELSARGLQLAANAVLQAESDPYLFYIACTRATNEIRLTFAGGGADGSAQEPSTYLGEVSRAIGPRPEPLVESRFDLSTCRHRWELPSRLARATLDLPDEEARQLAQTAERDLPDATEEISRAFDCRAKINRPLPESLEPEAAFLLSPGRVLSSSASRLETFVSCPFRHFARHYLRLEPRPEAILTPRSTGSAAHCALQRYFSKSAPPEDKDDAAVEIRRIFTELADKEEFRIFQADPPSAYRWQRTCHGLELFIRTEFDRLIDNEFQPLALELAFGLGPATGDPLDYADAILRGKQVSQITLPALEIELPDASLSSSDQSEDAPWRLRLRGQIDRLDIATGADKIYNALVIDYKHNPQNKKVVKELAKGTDLQLAVYLLVILSLLELSPAGGLYYGYAPQTRKASEKFERCNQFKFAMDGLIVSTAKDQIDPEGGFLKKRLETLPETLDDNLEAVLTKARERLAGLATEIIKGDIRPLPIRKDSNLACQYCDYVDVCRFDPRTDPSRLPNTDGGNDDS